MKKMVFKHVEYLLSKHKCVIVPDLGAFIVNIQPASYSHSEDGLLAPPAYAIVFNTDLRYDDGLLLSSVAQQMGVTYDVAAKKVKGYVAEMRQRLVSGVHCDCGNLGRLSIDEDENLTFSYNPAFNYSLVFGLSPIRIDMLSQIRADLDGRERKRPVLKYMAGGVAAAAVALFLFVAPSTQIGGEARGSHEAGFIQSLTQTLIPASAGVSESASLVSPDTEVLEQKMSVDSGVESVGEGGSSGVLQSPRSYYIVVGGEENKSRAEQLLRRIKSNKLATAAIIESADRYRIYVAKFEDKKEAERYLDVFRLENPSFKTAWLYSKRNY